MRLKECLPRPGFHNGNHRQFTPRIHAKRCLPGSGYPYATPAGAYTYRWFRNNVQIPGGRVITASAADDNVAYFVRVVSTLNGCIKQSPTANVQVDGALTVSLTTTTPCEGSPFTLTATPSRSASFRWSLDGAVISSEIGPTLKGDRAGTYSVTVTSATCSARQILK